MIRAGVCCIDITPQAGLAMSGFGARTEPALGAHDPLTVRAVVVNDTALVVADVLGLHEQMSRRIRERCCLPAHKVVLSALHTHGGPAAMVGRGGAEADPSYCDWLEAACVSAIDRAAAGAVPARILTGHGADPDVARNRRHADGLLDRSLPVVRIEAVDGRVLAAITSYACHPVVLGADNRLWTADYPHVVRARLEAAWPGAMAIFATGCCGDANTGHSAQASISLAANPSRSFAAAEGIGARIADAALAAAMQPVDGSASVTARDCHLNLHLARRESLPPQELARLWRGERLQAEPMRALMLDHWIRWAEGPACDDLAPWLARVSVLDWAGLAIIGLPGEIFAETALAVRMALGGRPALVLGFAEGNPGYIPPAAEYAFGGYEVDEAHRYYGMPAGFALGSAEALCAAARGLLGR
jgi:neutral ceramidase